MKCQYTVWADGAIFWSGEGQEPIGGSVSCQTAISNWRQCGSGAAVKCRVEIGYCDAHGGMDRATEEMVRHMATHAVAAPCSRQYHYDREGKCLGCGEMHRTKFHASTMHDGLGGALAIVSEQDGTVVRLTDNYRGVVLTLDPYSARLFAESLLEAAQEKPWLPFLDDEARK